MASDEALAMLQGRRGRNLCSNIAFVDQEERAHDGLEAMVAAAGGWSAFLATADDHALLAHLAQVVDAADYWSVVADPHHPPVVDGAETERLAPVADALIVSPGARWWSTPLDRDRQHLVHHLFFTDDAAPVAADLEANDLELVMNRERDAETRAAVAADRSPSPSATTAGGVWWSHPRGAWETTRSLGSLPAIDLVCVEDTFGPTRALVWPATIDPAARVYEINSVKDWQDLTVRYPRDVTYSRRWYWSGQTGWEGRWVVPDWVAVASDYDGVHLSVIGDLTVTGWAIPVDDARSFLAGWTPDQTYWLNNVIGVDRGAQSWDGDLFDPNTWTASPHR